MALTPAAAWRERLSKATEGPWLPDEIIEGDDHALARDLRGVAERLVEWLEAKAALDAYETECDDELDEQLIELRLDESEARDALHAAMVAAVTTTEKGE